MISTETTGTMAYDEEKDTMKLHIEVDIDFPVEMAKRYSTPGLMIVSEVSEDMWGASLVAAALCTDSHTNAFPKELVNFALDALADLTDAERVVEENPCDCPHCTMLRLANELSGA